MAQTFNILRDSPTLTYPNGGEEISASSIAIQWDEPEGISTSEVVWYELFIAEDFAIDRKPLWMEIGTVPSGVSTFTYRVPNNIKGTRCRIGIRAINHKGQKSQISYSADNFTITNRKLPLPAVFTPVPNGTYFSFIPFVFDYAAVTGRCSQRAFYQVYYSSASLGVDWTLLAGNIMVGTDPINLDISNVATASDYSIKIELVDGTNVSEPVFLDGVTINNINYFLIDTVAPKGTIKIVDNPEYTKERNMVVELTAYDETSAVKDVRLQQTDLSDGTVTEGNYISMSEIASWVLTGNDGQKLVQAAFRDYADNIADGSDSSKYFRTYKSLYNREVTAFMYNDGDIYIAFAGEDNPSEGMAQLYKNQSLMATLDGDATAIVMYDDTPYIAIKDEENKGILQRYLTSSLETVRDNADEFVDLDNTIINSLYDTDSVINSMVVYDSKLFLGLENGKLLSFSGSTITEEDDTYENQRSIVKLATDGILLYIFFENTTEIMVMYVDANGSYVFTEIDTGE